MNRAINFLLCVAILIGLVMFFRAQSNLNWLQSEHDRLATKFGDLEVKDPDKFYIKRLETDNEMDFLWRVWRPSNVSLEYRSNWGVGNRSSGSNQFADGRESLFRCKIVPTEKGFQVHRVGENQAGSSGMGDKVLKDFLLDHWSELEIETVADGEHDRDQMLRFLTIRIPPELLEKLIKQKGGQRYKDFDNPVFEHFSGTGAAYTRSGIHFSGTGAAYTRSGIQ